MRFSPNATHSRDPEDPLAPVHPAAVIFTMNFDLRTGFLVDMPDLPLPGGPAALEALVEEHLIADIYDGDEAALHS